MLFRSFKSFWSFGQTLFRQFLAKLNLWQNTKLVKQPTQPKTRRKKVRKTK